jgi:hypothetical protein
LEGGSDWQTVRSDGATTFKRRRDTRSPPNV